MLSSWLPSFVDVHRDVWILLLEDLLPWRLTLNLYSLWIYWFQACSRSSQHCSKLGHVVRSFETDAHYLSCFRKAKGHCECVRLLFNQSIIHVHRRHWEAAQPICTEHCDPKYQLHVGEEILEKCILVLYCSQCEANFILLQPGLLLIPAVCILLHSLIQPKEFQEARLCCSLQRTPSLLTLHFRIPQYLHFHDWWPSSSSVIPNVEFKFYLGSFRIPLQIEVHRILRDSCSSERYYPHNLGEITGSLHAHSFTGATLPSLLFHLLLRFLPPHEQYPRQTYRLHGNSLHDTRTYHNEGKLKVWSFLTRSCFLPCGVRHQGYPDIRCQVSIALLLSLVIQAIRSLILQILHILILSWDIVWRDLALLPLGIPSEVHCAHALQLRLLL